MSAFATLWLAALAAATPAPHSLLALQDGTPLVVIRPAAGTHTSSFRLVVRSGGFSDPLQREGLAHLLEHLVFHGTYDQGEGALMDEVAAAGGHLNAFTSSQVTTYNLDAPNGSFLRLLERFTRSVTNPALQLARLDREKDVVSAEQRLRNLNSLMEIMDAHLFADRRGVSIIGTRETRRAIKLEDVTRFFATHYVPANVLLLAITPEEPQRVVEALERSFLLPPGSPRPPRVDGEVPQLPITEKALSWVTATVLAYLVRPEQVPTCASAAALLELRLNAHFIQRQGSANSVDVVCRTTRGHTFLVAAVVAHGLLASNNQVEAESILGGAARVAPSKFEKELMGRRWRARRSAALANPEALADALALGWGTAPEPDVDTYVRAALVNDLAEWPAIQTLLKDTIRPGRRVVLHYSPFEQ